MAPSFRRRPPFVRGIPIVREIRDLKAENPMNLQIEKPPKFISAHLPNPWKSKKASVFSELRIPGIQIPASRTPHNPR
jgi:hypothetical protein